MTRVYLADAMPLERSALRLMLLDLDMEIAGEADTWSITVAQIPTLFISMLIVDWELLPEAPTLALDELRKACLKAPAIILLGHQGAYHQSAVSVGADFFISKGELSERVAECLRTAAKFRAGGQLP